MGRVVYCANEFVPEEKARIGLFDRGFLFGDAAYEVTAVLGGRMIDNDLHLARFARSLTELSIPLPMPLDRIVEIQRELIARNNLMEGAVYLQVSRGEADREFLYAADLTPTFVAFTQAKALRDTKAQRNGVAVDIAPDPRWARRDIKTAMLLGQVMAKREARARGFDDVWFVENGTVTEGASSTAFIIPDDRRIVTRANSHATLPGCTRRALMRLCEAQGLVVEERSFSLAEAQSAVEAFQTSASSFVTPVVRIGETLLGGGEPGPLTRKLQAYYLDAAGIREAMTL
ncbi:D-amino-acid transaminase [Hoeflea olei]|uniref:Probable branched-chain-amino-acid aminotransferase n=1 Tax=Hoeflea olei TaxID=1480615 RepID=A0A1C1Z187_9HYPH|nr:D-amino-acid transaminase [Hoeflea olei]OCW59504.1 D-amino acid aminotransferase [Hoeflea olei]